MERNKKFINTDLVECFENNKSTKVRTSTRVGNGKTDIILTHSISMRLPLNKENYKKVTDNYIALTKDYGFLIEIDDIVEFTKTGSILNNRDKKSLNDAD